MKTKNQKKRKIITIGPTPPPIHGVSVFTENLLNSNITKDFNIFHLDTADRRTTKNIGKLDIQNIYLAIKHIFILLIKLITFRPSLVYLPISQNKFGFLRDGFFIILAKKLCGKVVIHLHGGIFDEFYRKTDYLTKLFVRISLKHADRSIVLCNVFKKIFMDLIPSEKVRVVYNGIEDVIGDDFILKKLKKIKKDKDKNKKYRLLFLSTLSKGKGVLDFIKSAIYINNKKKNIEFIVAGGWRSQEDKDEAVRLIEKNKLTSFVKFVGIVKGKEKKELLENSDILVFPTRYYYEGQPIVVIEAMMAGLPVITTGRSCLREMVKDGENGFIVPEERPDIVSEKALTLIRNKKVFFKISYNNREKFLKKFTLEICVNKIINVFKEIL